MSLLDGFPEIANLDDKKFDELVEEARSLLARYGKDWTDHNIHDPGITFLELFAWLAEMQIYQLNLVSDAHYRKFLKLMGFYTMYAEPARVNITFVNVAEEKTIEAGRQLITEVDTEKIVFETEEDITLIPARLKSIITNTDSQVIDNTRANEKEDIYYAAFGEEASEGATLELGFDKPLLKKENKLTVVLFEEDLPPPGSHADEPALVTPSASVIWEYLNSGKWNPLNIKKDATLALTRSGKVVFDGPPDMDEKDGLYWIRCRLKEGRYEIAPLVNIILLNTISAVQVETINNEDLGAGDGVPEQVVQLKRKTVLRSTKFRVNDVLDWIGLLKLLKEQQSSGKPSPGKRILGLFDHMALTLINKWKGDKEPDDALKYAIISSLNQILEQRNLYESDSFKDIKLPEEPKKRLAWRLRFTSEEEVRAINRFLIETAYTGKIAGNRLRLSVQKENGEWEDWYEVEDFTFSGPDDAHYRFNPEKCEITLGNGLNGRYPGKSVYLFNWDEIPGSDTEILREFLKNSFDIDWVITAKFEKTEDGRTIKVSTEKKYLSLSLNDEKTRVFLKIDDGRTDEFIVKMPKIYTSEKIRASYGTTLGSKGNLPKGLKWATREGFNGAQGINLKESTGGKDAESIEHAKARAKRDCRNIYRAITSGDFEQLARYTPGIRVARTKAIPNYNPDYPCVTVPDAVTVVTVPFTREGIAPIPGDGFRQTTLRHLDTHRLITTSVYVVGPEYVKVSVKCKVRVKKGSSPDEVKKRVQKALKKFLDPLEGGPDENGQDEKGWPFGRPVYPSEIYQTIEKEEGVDYVAGVSLDADSQYRKGNVITIPPIGLVYSGEHQVDII